MIVIVAQFEFPAESADALVEMVREMDTRTAQEPGCIHYRHAVDVSNDRRLILSEVWSDVDALERHFRSAHFRKFRAVARELGVRTELQQFRADPVSPEHEHHVRALLRKAAIQ